MTLVELLIVVTILVILMAATVPKIKPAMDKMRVREAARSIQTYFASARTTAMVTGRETGVMVERQATYNASTGSATLIDGSCALNLSQVEVSPPYCGDSLTSTCSATWNPAVGTPVPNTVTCKVTFSSALSVNIDPGDTIQFNNQGYWYSFDPPTATGQTYSVPIGSTTASVSMVANQGEATPFVQGGPGIGGVYPAPGVTPNPPSTATYRILRWPTKTDAPTLQLPSPACIDLTCSGQDPFDPSGNEAKTFDLLISNVYSYWPIVADDTSPIIVLFSPNGSVSALYTMTLGHPSGKPQTANPYPPFYVASTTTNQLNDSMSAIRPTEPIYLLVGQRQNIYGPNNPITNTQSNLNDFNCLWVSINSRSGAIAVTEMASITPFPTATGALETALRQSRSFARQSDLMEGK